MTLRIDRDTCIVLPRDEPYGVQYAARAVANDIRDVIGVAPPIVDAPPGDSGLVVRIARDERELAPDTFSIRAVTEESRPTTLIPPPSKRGVIYGLYHLSHAHVGTDPLKH